MSEQQIRITECPRDAMQGIHDYIPVDVKVAYLQQLLNVGFDTIDFGSFVSPKAIPQLKDTAEVLSKLDLSKISSKLLAIVANERGAIDACSHEEIDRLGYPFSISEIFQKRNTNSSIDQSLLRVEKIQNLCLKSNKSMVVYISMAFGNPYEEHWHPDIASEWTERLYSELEIPKIALSDTIGVATPSTITSLFSALIPQFPALEIGAHFHTTPSTWEEKIEAAYHAGCFSYDGAIKGYGGCPMATDQLTGNMATENIVNYFSKQQESFGLNFDNFDKAIQESSKVFLDVNH